MCGSRADFAAFKKELREVREQQWGSRPWNGVTEAEPFFRHVRSMVEAFTADAPVQFRGRRRQPGG
jgi:hypothetical protein